MKYIYIKPIYGRKPKIIISSIYFKNFSKGIITKVSNELHKHFIGKELIPVSEILEKNNFIRIGCYEDHYVFDIKNASNLLPEKFIKQYNKSIKSRINIDRYLKHNNIPKIKFEDKIKVLYDTFYLHSTKKSQINVDLRRPL